jgi:hypothetical protein
MKSNYNAKIKSVLSEMSDDKYDVVALGMAEIGGDNFYSKKELTGTYCNEFAFGKVLMTKSNANSVAKRLNTELNPGERLRKIKYVVAEVDLNTGKYTGK